MQQPQDQEMFEDQGITSKHARCTVCNRILKDPKSVAAGVGPKCAGKSRSMQPSKPRRKWNED